MSIHTGQDTLGRRAVRLFLALCLMSLASLCATAQQRRASTVSLVPAGSVAVAKVNWPATRRDERLKAIVKGDEFERILDTYGIGSDEVSEFVIFSGFKTTEDGTLGVLLSGTFSAQRVASHLKAQGWTEEEYKAHRLFVNPKDNSRLVLLRANLLASGTEQGVKRVVDVEQNPRTSLMSKPPFSTLLARFATTRQPISFMMGLPQDYQMAADAAVKVVSMLLFFPGGGALGWVMQTIGMPRVLGLSITHLNDKFPVELLALMKDETSAGIISGTLNIAQGMGMSLAANDMTAEDRETLKNMSVTRDGALLSIKMLMRERDLPPTR